MTPPPGHRRVGILGGGISGIALAAQLGADVDVLEKRNRIGGLCGTIIEDGFTFDAGPTIITAPFLLEGLWELAGRWGHVAPDGVHLSLRLTHEGLAHLVGARRPSVTSALSELQEQGRLTPDGPGRWILRGDPPRLSAS